MINELLDFRKLELDKVRIKVRELNLVSFTKNVASHFKEEAFIKNIHLSIDTDIQDIAVWGDESMLEKIIFNILSNAFKVNFLIDVKYIRINLMVDCAHVCS